MTLSLEQRAARCRAELDHATGDISSRERCVLRYLREAVEATEERYAPLLALYRRITDQTADACVDDLRAALDALSPPPENCVCIYTDASLEYDLSSTMTEATVGYCGARLLRKVSTPEPVLSIQRDRYRAMGFLADNEAELLRHVANGRVTLDAKP